MHADFLDRLTESGASAVLFDVVFTEPSWESRHDQRLAQALERHGHVFLPMFHVEAEDDPSGLRGLFPTDLLRDAARGIGHIDIRTDADGVVRRIRLWEHHIPQLTLRLYQDLIAQERIEPADTLAPFMSHDGNAHEIRIPYRGGTSHYPQVSYVDILEGRVPRSLLADRIILVGATAKGLGDHHPTPYGGAKGGMPGIEIQANLLDGLMQGNITQDMPKWLASLLSLLSLWLFLALVWAFKFRHMAKLTLVILVMMLLGAWGLLAMGWWWPITAGLCSVLAACILISWRCQAAALRWFQQEIARLETVPRLIPEPAPNPARTKWDSGCISGSSRSREPSRACTILVSSLPTRSTPCPSRPSWWIRRAGSFFPAPRPSGCSDRTASPRTHRCMIYWTS